MDITNGTLHSTLTILLVEDDEDDYVFLRNLLEDVSPNKFTLEWVSNYESAKQAISAGQYDVCILDYQLGVRSGLDILRETERKETAPPFIVLTGHGDFQVDMAAMEAGALDFLDKRLVNADSLERSIRYAIERGRIERELRSAVLEKERANEKLMVTLQRLKFAEEELRIQNTQLIHAQELIELERRRYQELFEFAPDGYVVTDSNGIIVEANRTACILLGAKKESLNGMSFFLSIDGKDQQTIQARINELKSLDDRTMVEVSIKRTSGECFPAAISIGAVPQSLGTRDVHLRFSIRDITARRKMEEELEQYQEHLERLVEERTATIKTILDTVPVGVVVAREQGRDISYVSPSTVQVLGEVASGDAADSVSGNYEFMNPDRTPYNCEDLPLMRSLKGDCISNKEILVRRRNGSEASIVVNSAPVRDSSGHITGAIASLTDITERKCSEEAVRRSEVLLQKVLEALPVGVSIVDQDGCIVSTNPAGRHIWGMEKLGCVEEYGGYKGWRLDTGEPIKAKEWAVFRAITSGETTLNEELEIEGFDGKRRIILHSAIPIRDRQGKITGSISVDQDITSSKRAERQIQYLTRQLIKGQENERQLIFYNLHDGIGQELSALKISLDTLLKGVPDGSSVLVERVRKLSRMLQDAIMAIRELAYTLKPATLDQLGLIRTLSQYCENFGARSGVIIDFSTTGMDNLNLDYDTSITLYRLVQESLDNVRRHSEACNAAVRLVASYPQIILSVRDNGRGFDVKNRLASASKEKCMGLRSMEERVALLGGKMKIESFSMRGTAIRFEIPFKERSVG